MIDLETDVAVVGSGFGGSLTALVLQRAGLRTALIDRASHPRFIIGESSTPVANLMLARLAARYDLPRVAPLAEYGTWQACHADLPCGLKRGFSYFKHAPGQEFQSRADHANELLVAASAEEADADTHWFRPQFDAWLAREAMAALVPLLDQTEITAVAQRDDWLLTGHRLGEPVRLRAGFVVDASGEGGFLAWRLGLRGDGALRTHSRALYGHFTGAGLWRDQISGSALGEHPFACDDAALHHILDGAWMWVLRFNNGVTSAGFMLDTRRYPLDLGVSPEEEWGHLLARYPSLQVQFGGCQLTPLCGHLRRTGRLQRRCQRFAGPNWAMLPLTAYGLDALHSTGNAHTLCGIERLTTILAERFGRDDLYAGLQEYERLLRLEIDLADKIVHGCYLAFRDFGLLAAYAMFYFAAATQNEHLLRTGRAPAGSGFLLAHDDAFRQALDACYTGLQELAARDVLGAAAVRDFTSRVRQAIAPYNVAGLCDDARRNMYPFAG